MQRFDRKPDIGYIPTEAEAIAEVLKLAEVAASDVFYDLGCGDGRLLIAAAQQFGTRGVGVDIDPERIQKAKEDAARASVSNLVEFRHQDLFETNFSDATVVFLYLLPHLNLRLRPQLFRQLKPGTRIISRDFDMGEWLPERSLQLQTPEEPKFYRWTIGITTSN
ncbi:SAM-dependent methyltransferase [Leptothermofonsia sp. ETS-13]|uniref:SAM-dependent methyltransferase n=1 Tax=Leptothermofonsia sp. ETS-13 TaxID=3035696 RepID=UPI003BA15601